jgi:hypothetical protein
LLVLSSTFLSEKWNFTPSILICDKKPFL